MNTHRLNVADFEHTRPVRFKWVPLIFALIVAGVGGYAWIHSA